MEEKASKKTTSAERQRRTRGKAHWDFLLEADNEKAKELAKNMSTSNLISLLPRLMSSKHKSGTDIVCGELIRRVRE